MSLTDTHSGAGHPRSPAALGQGLHRQAPGRAWGRKPHHGSYLWVGFLDPPSVPPCLSHPQPCTAAGKCSGCRIRMLRCVCLGGSAPPRAAVQSDPSLHWGLSVKGHDQPSLSQLQEHKSKPGSGVRVLAPVTSVPHIGGGFPQALPEVTPGEHFDPHPSFSPWTMERTEPWEPWASDSCLEREKPAWEVGAGDIEERWRWTWGCTAIQTHGQLANEKGQPPSSGTAGEEPLRGHRVHWAGPGEAAATRGSIQCPPPNTGTHRFIYLSF